MLEYHIAKESLFPDGSGWSGGSDLEGLLTIIVEQKLLSENSLLHCDKRWISCRE